MFINNNVSRNYIANATNSSLYNMLARLYTYIRACTYYITVKVISAGSLISLVELNLSVTSDSKLTLKLVSLIKISLVNT